MAFEQRSPGFFYNPQMPGRGINTSLPGAGSMGFSAVPGVGQNGVGTPQGLDKLTMAMLLMNALGTGFQAYSQAQQQKKDREFRERQYNEGTAVREEGRNRLLQPPNEPSAPSNDFFNPQQNTLGAGVAAPPPVGPNAQRDEELQRILRARLGGSY